MKAKIIAKRYALGMVRAIDDDQEYQKIYREIQDFSSLIEKNEKFKNFIFSPSYSSHQKKEILSQILKKSSFSEKSKRFFLMLAEKNRLILLGEIIELIQTYWNERKNIHTFEVTSAYPLTKEQKEKLAKKLEKMVKGKVAIKFQLEPSLLGGIRIKKGDILYDGSIKGNLLKLKEKILGEE